MQSLFQVMLHSKHQTCTFNLQNDTEVTIVWASHHSKDENDDLTKHTARGIFIGKHNLIQEAISAMLQPTMTMASSVQSMDSGNSTLGPPRFIQRPLAGTASVFSPSVTFCTALSLSVYYLSK